MEHASWSLASTLLWLRPDEPLVISLGSGIVVPVTLFAFNNLLVVTWPDRDADAAVEKNTLATRLKPEPLRFIHGGCTLLSFTGLMLINFPSLVVSSSLIAYPLMAMGWYTFTRREISRGTIWALHLLIVAQSLAWLYLGMGGIV